VFVSQGTGSGALCMACIGANVLHGSVKGAVHTVL
jgi:hypothetical protein